MGWKNRGESGPVSDEGCWYCGEADGDLIPTFEFDCMVHESCIERTLREDPSDLEAPYMAREFGLARAAGGGDADAR